jgi:glycerophosphoryl diester phosphodiesterase
LQGEEKTMTGRLVRWMIMIGSIYIGPCGTFADAESLDLRQESSVRVVAHRGWRDPGRAENSLTEMKATRAHGICMLEMDLAASRDGSIYVLHDDTLDRSTTGHGAIATASAGSIAGVRLKTGLDEVTTDPLPRLSKVLRWARTVPGTELMLDIKNAPAATVAGLVRRSGMTRRVIVLTFDAATAASVVSADPDWRISVLISTRDDLDRYRLMVAGRPLAAYVPTDADAALFQHVHAAGWPVVTDAVMPTPSGSLDQQAGNDGGSVYSDYLADRPVDFLVTNHAMRVHAAVKAAIRTPVARRPGHEGCR